MKVVITGGLGQDGVLLAKKLVSNGTDVVLVDKSASEKRLWRLRAEGLVSNPKVSVEVCENTDLKTWKQLLDRHSPDKVFLFGANSSTIDSLGRRSEFFLQNCEGVLGQLDAILESDRLRSTFVGVAISSEIFASDGQLKHEGSPISPSNPYGESKARLFEGLKLRRSGTDSLISSFIFFPHESHLRSQKFLVPKIVTGIGNFLSNRGPTLRLGDHAASRDWSSARDLMNLVLKVSELSLNDDFVLGSGRTRTVFDVLTLTLRSYGLPGNVWMEKSTAFLEHEGESLVIAQFNDDRFRATANSGAIADTSKILKFLGPETLPRISFESELAHMAGGSNAEG